MTGALPPQLLPLKRIANAAQRDLHAVLRAEVGDKQVGRRAGRAVAELARVFFDDFCDQRLDDAARRARATAPLAIGQPCGRLKFVVGGEARPPVVNGLARDAQTLGDCLGALAFAEPEQGLCAAQLSTAARTGHEAFEEATLAGLEREVSHLSFSGFVS